MSDLALMGAASNRHVWLDRAMILTVLIAGAAAATQVGDFFWLATPLVAFGAWRASRRAAPPRFEPVAGDPNQMPMRAEIAVYDAVAKLPTGDARRLLGDVVRQARPLFGTTNSHFDARSDEQARREACDLVVAACDTALELSRLDALLASDERARRASGGSARDKELVERLSSARTLFASRLRAAASALGAMYASGVEHGTPSSDVVAELTADLSADAVARTKARAEMDELLGRHPDR